MQRTGRQILPSCVYLAVQDLMPDSAYVILKSQSNTVLMHNAIMKSRWLLLCQISEPEAKGPLFHP